MVYQLNINKTERNVPGKAKIGPIIGTELTQVTLTSTGAEINKGIDATGFWYSWDTT